MSSRRENPDLERALLVRMVQAIKPSAAAVLMAPGPRVVVSHGLGDGKVQPNEELIHRIIDTGAPLNVSQGGRAQLGVPLKEPDGTVAGVMYVEIEAPRRLKNRDLAILQGLGRQVEEKLWATPAAESAPLGDHFLGEATRVAQATLRKVERTLKPERAAIFVDIDEEPTVLAALGLPMRDFVERAPVSMPLLEHIWSRGRAVFVEDARNDLKYREYDGVVRHRIRSVTACPLKAGDGSISGMIYLDSQSNASQFLAPEMAALQRLAFELEDQLAELLGREEEPEHGSPPEEADQVGPEPEEDLPESEDVEVAEETAQGSEEEAGVEDQTDATIAMVMSLSAELGDLIEDSQRTVGHTEPLEENLELPDVAPEFSSPPRRDLGSVDDDDEYALPDLDLGEPEVRSAEEDEEPEEAEEPEEPEEPQAVRPTLTPVFTKKRLLTRPKLRRPQLRTTISEEEEEKEEELPDEDVDQTSAPDAELFQELPLSTPPEVETKLKRKFTSPWPRKDEESEASSESPNEAKKAVRRRRSNRPHGAVDFEELRRLEREERDQWESRAERGDESAPVESEEEEAEAEAEGDLSSLFPDEDLETEQPDSDSEEDTEDVEPEEWSESELAEGDEDEPVDEYSDLEVARGEEPEDGFGAEDEESEEQAEVEEAEFDESEQPHELEVARWEEPEDDFGAEDEESEEQAEVEGVEFEESEQPHELEVARWEDADEPDQEVAEDEESEEQAEVEEAEYDEGEEAEEPRELEVARWEEPEDEFGAEDEEFEEQAEVEEDEIRAPGQPGQLELQLASEGEAGPADLDSEEELDLVLEPSDEPDPVALDKDPLTNVPEPPITEPLPPSGAESASWDVDEESDVLTLEPSLEEEMAPDLELMEQPEATIEEEIAVEPQEEAPFLNIPPGGTVQISSEDAAKLLFAARADSELGDRDEGESESAGNDDGQRADPVNSSLALEPAVTHPTVAITHSAPAPRPGLWQRILATLGFGPRQPQNHDLAAVSVKGRVVLEEGSPSNPEPVEVTLLFPTHSMKVIIELNPEGDEYTYHGGFRGEAPTHLALMVRKEGFHPVKLSNVRLTAVDGTLQAQASDITLIPYRHQPTA